MRELAIDIETYSPEDIRKCGAYRYASHPDFKVLLFAYAFDHEEPRVVDLACGESLPPEVLRSLRDPDVLKTAWNAAFERICLSRMLGLPVGQYLPPDQWDCSMVAAAHTGFPLSLEDAGKALDLSADEAKLKEGKTLIRYFCRPAKNGKPHQPDEAPDKWATFKEYCRRDVRAEQVIRSKVTRLQQPEWERKLWLTDQAINDRGVMLDTVLAKAAVAIEAEHREALMQEARELTGKENPNSPVQLKQYLKERTGFAVASLSKAGFDELESRLQFWPDARRVVAIRRELAKTSNAKYGAMLDCVCPDGRVRGLLQFCGAVRTGRWAGRLVQVQNLPQNHLPDIDRARSLARQGNLDELALNYGNPPQVLSELIRTALIAKGGCVFHVCDFSAIEARVIAWVAGEKWVLDVFREGGDIYCSTASKMFGVPVSKHGPNAHLRQRGKVAVLALGYGGGVPALEAMGGARLGLTADEMTHIVKLWRESNPHIVKLWRSVDRAAQAAICGGHSASINRGIRFERRWGCLIITLPSGRSLCYPRARIGLEQTAWGEREIIEYEGLEQTSRKWSTLRTYGGKLTENIVQAIARDLLGNVLLRAEEQNLHTVFHVHDEIIVEAPATLKPATMEALFSQPPAWALDLPLKGAGYTTPYYLKD